MSHFRRGGTWRAQMHIARQTGCLVGIVAKNLKKMKLLENYGGPENRGRILRVKWRSQSYILDSGLRSTVMFLQDTQYCF